MMMCDKMHKLQPAARMCQQLQMRVLQSRPAQLTLCWGLSLPLAAMESCIPVIITVKLYVVEIMGSMQPGLDAVQWLVQEGLRQVLTNTCTSSHEAWVSHTARHMQPDQALSCSDNFAALTPPTLSLAGDGNKHGAKHLLLSKFQRNAVINNVDHDCLPAFNLRDAY